MPPKSRGWEVLWVPSKEGLYTGKFGKASNEEKGKEGAPSRKRSSQSY